MSVNASEIAMRHLDLTLPSPAENLACDEALLDWCESGEGAECLRFWESTEPFVVVGYANKVAIEVNVPACEARKIPVLRRCTGGGTVVQGPGCLNYALILPIGDDGPYHDITIANQFIMRRNRTALDSVGRDTPCAPFPQQLGETTDESARGDARPTDGGQKTALPAIAIRGHTDLAIGERKFSGNSQRRHKKFLLFHGTFLLNFDITLIGHLLRMPSKQPDYRESRNHGEFLTNISVTADKIKDALIKAWDASLPVENPPLEKIEALAREKYATREWNFKF